MDVLNFMNIENFDILEKMKSMLYKEEILSFDNFSQFKNYSKKYSCEEIQLLQNQLYGLIYSIRDDFIGSEDVYEFTFCSTNLKLSEIMDEIKTHATEIACIKNEQDTDRDGIYDDDGYLEVTSIVETKSKMHVYKLKGEMFVLIYLKKYKHYNDDWILHSCTNIVKLVQLDKLEDIKFFM